MIKVTVLYPNKPGSHFDADYYINVHMPMAIELMGPALKGVSAEIGLAGGAPGQPAPYAAIAAFTCESVEAFSEAFTPHTQQLMSDIPNYTDIQPVLQMSEIRISQ
jgi:uncharacterized protein (TIGR02118 family)